MIFKPLRKSDPGSFLGWPTVAFMAPGVILLERKTARIIVCTRSQNDAENNGLWPYLCKVHTGLAG